MSKGERSTILILPGICNSGDAHWQTRWEKLHAQHPRFQLKRIAQTDWDHPICAQWVQALEQHVRNAGQGTVLVAHSLACLMLVHWAAQTTLAQHIDQALLVAVPDPQGAAFPRDASGFGKLPGTRLPFPSKLLCSSNDPYSSLDFSRRCAAKWGCSLSELGALGHINDQSGLGDWPQGWAALGAD
ncbi:alpha/beta hydrolase [Variovorax sp. PCZ-1]|uniref:RBBP9/YdeN family alpha/beta hydrolase n=1 Tax=Variovorax sp. PCZ-1 TaxID=2835533 RepID=UPI001BD0DC8D|nr:alpha/beta hydrolase [Variovorax sp. PCZ-1]MBS7807976.1 alpha/beta hydrolase [Variovorax sp. PCZ-1]